MTPETAELIAIRGLAWLAGQEDLLNVFLGATGASLEDAQRRAGDPEFLGSVLDFILMDDDWVLGFAAENGLAPEDAMNARRYLPGGDVPSWT